MATVSRVLTGNAPVADATRQRVLRAVQELGYSPNAFARSLATNRSGGVGVVINDLSSPYFAPMLQGIESVVEPTGFHLMVSSGHARAEPERRAVELLCQRRSDALILHVEGMTDDDLLTLSKGQTPVVIIGRFVAELPEHSVYLDNERGGMRATRHLLEKGHRRIAHITGPLALHDSRERLAGYRRALEEAGLAYDARFVAEADYQEEGGKRAAQRLLGRGLGFTAIFVGNDQMAVGALMALREAGLSIPGDVSVVGYDDVFIARYLHPGLTTIHQPLREMGRAAARLVLADLGVAPEEVVGEEVMRKFEPSLIARESVASPSRS